MNEIELAELKYLFGLSEDPTHLKELTISHYQYHELPKTIGKLTQLTSLNLSWCKSLTTLPESIGNLTNLTSLVLKGCESLMALPESIGNLIQLTSLDLDLGKDIS